MEELRPSTSVHIPLISYLKLIVNSILNSIYCARASIEKTRRNIAAAADWITEAGYDVVFIPMHQAPGDDDTAEITQIRGMMKQPSTVASHPGSPEKTMGILRGMGLIIGLRLHSLIRGAAAGTPIVGIEHDPKIRGFMEQAGVREYICEVESPPRL